MYNTGYVKITTSIEIKSGVTLLLPYGTGSGDRNTGGAATIHLASDGSATRLINPTAIMTDMAIEFLVSSDS